MVVIDATWIYIGLPILVIIGGQVNKNGGLKIVIWRILGIRGFIRVERQADGSATRGTYRWSKYVKGTILQYYSLKKGGPTWFVGGPNESVRVFGFPQWVYNYNDARPLPLEQVATVTREIEVKVKGSDGTERTEKQMRPIIVAGKPIDPMLIHSFATNKSIEQFNKFSDKSGMKVKWGMYGVMIVLTLIMVGLNVYYSYLFGINVNCAIHSKICP